MKYRVNRDINRVGLHDSRIVCFELSENQIILNFDWAKITKFSEKQLHLILGACQLKLNGIIKSNLQVEKSNGSNIIDFPEGFPKGFEEVLQNISETDNQIIISGFLTTENDYLWANWTIEFKNFEFSWDNYVTHEAWKNGALPRYNM